MGCQSKRIYWEKGAQAESSRVREPRRTALLPGSKSWVHGNGVSSWLSLASHLAWSMFVLTQGPSWWQVNLSAKMDSSAKDSGRLIRHLMGWHLLPAFGPSDPSQLVFWSSTMSLSRPPIVRQLMQVAVIMPIKAGSFGQRSLIDALTYLKSAYLWNFLGPIH